MTYSVVVPAFNAEKYIIQCVWSLLRQTLKPELIIIVDDNSTDGTWDLLNLHFGKNDLILLVKNQINLGYAASINSVVHHVKTDFLGKMDADDVADLTRFEQQMRASERFPDVAFYTCRSKMLMPSGWVYEKISEKNCHSAGYHFEDWFSIYKGTRTYTDPSLFFSIDKFKKIGGYSTYSRSGMDVDLCLRLTEVFGRALVICEGLIFKRQISTSIGFRKETRLNNLDVRIRALKRNPSKLNLLENIGNVSLKNDNTGLCIGFMVFSFVHYDWFSFMHFSKCFVERMKINPVLDIHLLVLKKLIYRLKEKKSYRKYKLCRSLNDNGITQI